MTVYLVGAGPGDPGLMTARSLELIARADVIIHDRLIPASALDGARTDAQLIYAGKEGGGEQVPQEQITRLLIEHGRSAEVVVRLKGGDPFVFGRGGEEAMALSRAGVPFEVVPGLSSALAGPALAGIPVTHRGRSAALLVLSGHDLSTATALLGEVTPGSVTLVILMAREKRAAIAQRLLLRGWPATIGAAIVQNASLPTQSVWSGTLQDLATPERSAGIDREAPSLLVIGTTVELAEELGGALSFAA